MKSLDLLLIDTEGYDGKIVIDFLTKSNARPIIIFEYIHINYKTLENTLDQLNKKNYVIFKIEENIICYPEEKKILQLI